MNKIDLCIRAANSKAFKGVKEDAGCGIHIIVNSWVLSAQAGWGNYHSCDPSRHPGMILEGKTIRPDCKIALWPHPKGEMITLDNNSVMGWVPWAAVFEIAHWLMTLDHVPAESEVKNYVLESVRLAKTDSMQT